ncbi:hypothetical protein [Corynebacterium aquilae]|uniref:ABC transporter permease n=1 Tax=Corynebacterium aquilae DSM 44791 TaxID=1431546 RepID=A0A1L7CI86_9CORY|nr:hypothetical protein [Corynebacterium aquilae]APT85525.1 hypothetical protein CAQU_11245 [Corynebacterium aquilae DSM 44791]
MTFPRLLLSEWTKLRSTKSFWWVSALMLIFCVGLNAMTGWGTAQLMNSSGQGSDAKLNYDAASALGLVNQLGFIFIIIGAVMVVTAEYRHNYAPTTFLASPNRPLVLVAKALLYGVIAVILTSVTSFLSILALKMTVGPYSDQITIAGDDVVKRLLWVLPLAALLLVPFCVGIATIVRQTAGATTLMILWFAVLENIIAILPKVGIKIGQWLPFTNYNAWISDRIFNTHFEQASTGMYYFAAWSLAIFILGCIITSRRDA